MKTKRKETKKPWPKERDEEMEVVSWENKSSRTFVLTEYEDDEGTEVNQELKLSRKQFDDFLNCLSHVLAAAKRGDINPSKEPALAKRIGKVEVSGWLNTEQTRLTVYVSKYKAAEGPPAKFKRTGVLVLSVKQSMRLFSCARSTWTQLYGKPRRKRVKLRAA